MNSTALNAKKIADRVKIYDGLRKLYKTVKPRKLRRLLEDDLSWKYIDCYCASEPKSRKKLGVKRLVVLKCAYKARLQSKGSCLCTCAESLCKPDAGTGAGTQGTSEKKQQ